MLEVVHCASGGAAAGSLRALCANRSAELVIEIVDPLAIGPLRDLDRPEGVAERRQYLRRLFERIGETECFERLAARIGLPELAAAMPDASRAVAWCGPNADEQLMLRAVCAGWRDRPLHVVDVGAGVGTDGIGPQRAVGACSPDALRIAERGARQLSDAERVALAADWERLLRSNHRLRLFEGGAVIGCDEDRFDSLLLAACPRDFASAARIVGKVMGESVQLIGDTFLDHRLRELIARGGIDAEDATARLASLRVRRRPPAMEPARM